MALRALYIRQVSTEMKHPQVNYICDCIQKTCGDAIKTLVHENTTKDIGTTLDIVDEVIESVHLALRLSQSSTMFISPGTMVFGRDILLSIHTITKTDFNLIPEHRQTVTDESN